MVDSEFDFLLNDGRPIKGYYVYGWVNADWNGVYFYIGKGPGGRYKDIKNRGKAFEAIYRNWRCYPVILVDGLTEDEAELCEVVIKERMIFDCGFPVMDGEGHGRELKHLAIQRAKREKRRSDPNYTEGRPRREIPEEFISLLEKTKRKVITVAEACEALGVHKTQWYRWKKEVAA